MLQREKEEKKQREETLEIGKWDPMKQENNDGRKYLYREWDNWYQNADKADLSDHARPKYQAMNTVNMLGI